MKLVVAIIASRFIKRSSTTTVRWLLRYKGHTVILYMCSLCIVVLRHAKPLPDAQLVRRKIHLWSFDKEDMKKILLIHFEVLWTCPCLSFGPSLLSLPSPAVSPIFHAYTAYTTLRHVVPLRCCILWRPCPASLHLRYSERSQVVSVAFQAKLNGSYSFKVFKVLEIWLFFVMWIMWCTCWLSRLRGGWEREKGDFAEDAWQHLVDLVDKSGGGCCSFYMSRIHRQKDAERCRKWHFCHWNLWGVRMCPSFCRARSASESRKKLSSSGKIADT